MRYKLASLILPNVLFPRFPDLFSLKAAVSAISVTNSRFGGMESGICNPIIQWSVLFRNRSQYLAFVSVNKHIHLQSQSVYDLLCCILGYSATSDINCICVYYGVNTYVYELAMHTCSI